MTAGYNSLWDGKIDSIMKWPDGHLIWIIFYEMLLLGSTNSFSLAIMEL